MDGEPTTTATTERPTLSVVIVSWNTVALLRECLKSLFEETKSSLEVFVVDNASADGSAAMVAESFPNVHLIVNTKNSGFAAANNQALVKAKGDFLFLLNPDTVVLDGAADTMVAWLEDHPGVGALACTLLNSDGTLQPSCNYFYGFWRSLVDNQQLLRWIPPDHFLARCFLAKRLMCYWDHRSVRRVEWARGAAVMVRRAAVEEVGLLDEQFRLYAEETDWYHRLLAAGWPLYFLPDARIVHHRGASAKQRRVDAFILKQRSFYQLLLKHYSPASLLAYRIRLQVRWWAGILVSGAALFLRLGDDSKRRRWSQNLEVYLAASRWNVSPESRTARLRERPHIPFPAPRSA